MSLTRFAHLRLELVYSYQIHVFSIVLSTTLYNSSDYIRIAMSCSSIISYSCCSLPWQVRHSTTLTMFRVPRSTSFFRGFATHTFVTGFTGAVGNTPLVGLSWYFHGRLNPPCLADLPQELIRKDWIPYIWQSWISEPRRQRQGPSCPWIDPRCWGEGPVCIQSSTIKPSLS